MSGDKNALLTKGINPKEIVKIVNHLDLTKKQRQFILSLVEKGKKKEEK